MACNQKGTRILCQKESGSRGRKGQKESPKARVGFRYTSKQ